MIKVLIVDDKTENIYLLQSMLDTNGFKSISAKNGAEALGLLRTITPDLIIADILMPVMDGFTLCRECKKDEILKNIPFFFYTATYTDAKDEEYALSLGADRFILKPQEPDAFLKIINDFLEDFRRKDFHVKKVVQLPETVVLKEYNEVLIRKIEDKILQSEKTEKELRKYSEELEKEILEHKKSEASLLVREQQLSSIYRTVGDVIFHIAVEAEDRYRFISVNHAFSKVTGIEEAMIIGKMVNEIIPEPSLSFVLEKYRQAIKENSILRWEEVSEYPTGQLIGDVSIAPVVNDKGQCTHLVGTVHDITERKRANEALVESETKYRQLVTQSPDGIFIVDLSGRFLSVNRAICDTLKYTEEELLSMNIFEIIPEKYHSTQLQRLETIIKGKSTTTHSEYEVIGKDKNAHFVEVMSVPYIRGNDITGFQGIARDITERISTTEKLKLAKEKAEESDKLKTAFLHNISHETRTPMNAIVGFSDLILDPDLTPEIRNEFIQTIVQSSNQLLSIITQIVNMATIETGQEKIYEKEISLNSIFKMVIDQFHSEAVRKNISLIYNTALPDKEDKIKTDETKLIQIISNLLGNALKFTKKGYIDFGYVVKDKYLEFHFKDTGIGIPKDLHEKIFERFRQVETTLAREYEGSGLGLSISKAYVELLGGKIWLTSTLGEGSEFYFTIPYNKVSLNKIPEKGVADKYKSELKKAITLLVAEDEDNNFKLIAQYLSNANIVVIHAANGNEAVEICRSSQKINLVLMDLKMPVMNGFDAVKKIREFLPDLPIIAQTAYSSETDKEKAIACGCNDFISKPFKKEELLTLIRKHLVLN
jgi:PAS domain S-box-containing protein